MLMKMVPYIFIIISKQKLLLFTEKGIWLLYTKGMYSLTFKIKIKDQNSVSAEKF